MSETGSFEDELRTGLRDVAGEAPQPQPNAVPPELARRVGIRRVRTVAALTVTLLVLSAGTIAGVRRLSASPTPAVSPTVISPTPSVGGSSPLPEAVTLVRTYRLQPSVTAAGGGRFFGVVVAGQSTATVVRIDQDGGTTSQALTDPLAGYFSQAQAEGGSLYVGTAVISRFTGASDEVLRLDASTLTVSARATVPGNVVGFASDANDLWVALPDRILRLDPVTLAVRATEVIPGLTPPPAGSSSIGSLALGPGGLWATAGDVRRTTLYRFDPASLTILGQVGVPQHEQGIRVVGGPESVWLTGSDFALSVDPSGRLGAASALGAGLQAAAASGRGLVALSTVGANAIPEYLLHVDAAGRVVARSQVGDAGARVDVDGRDVWLLRGLSVAHWALLNPAPS